MNNIQGQQQGQEERRGTGTSRPDGRASEEEQYSEGKIARTIEHQTAKLPSDFFLWAAVGAIGTSAVLEFSGNRDKARFVGQWVSPFLLLGVYNKLVKIAGSDRLH